MPDVNNKIDVRGDGSVVLYQRGNSDGSINEIFQMRIRIPLSASKGYFRGSTSESNQGRATQVALNKFDELVVSLSAPLTFEFEEANKSVASDIVSGHKSSSCEAIMTSFPSLH